MEGKEGFADIKVPGYGGKYPCTLPKIPPASLAGRHITKASVMHDLSFVGDRTAVLPGKPEFAELVDGQGGRDERCCRQSETRTDGKSADCLDPDGDRQPLHQVGEGG